MGNLMLGVTLQWKVEIFLVALYYKNQDKLRPDWPLGLYGDFTLVQKIRRTVGRKGGGGRVKIVFHVVI